MAAPNLWTQVFPWARSLPWRHNERDGVSDHQPHDCLRNRLFRRRSKKTSKLCVTGLCKGNSTVTSEFPAQRASYAGNVPIWWRHHDAGGLHMTNKCGSLRSVWSFVKCMFLSTCCNHWDHVQILQSVNRRFKSFTWVRSQTSTLVDCQQFTPLNVAHDLRMIILISDIANDAYHLQIDISLSAKCVYAKPHLYPYQRS